VTGPTLKPPETSLRSRTPTSWGCEDIKLALQVSLQDRSARTTKTIQETAHGEALGSLGNEREKALFSAFSEDC